MKHFTSTNREYCGSHRCFKDYTAVLRALRVRSVRRGVWNRALSRLEKAQVDLTLRVVNKVRSPLLARVLESIIEKLQSAMENRVLRIICSVGFPMARRLGEIAKGWGNESAEKWVHDRGFARFLAVMDLNMSTPRLDCQC
jgi:hypothetical protein